MSDMHNPRGAREHRRYRVWRRRRAGVSDLPMRLGPRRALVVRGARRVIRSVLKSRGYRAGRYRVASQECEDSTAAALASAPERCAANARAYAGDESVVGVIGPYNSGCATTELRILAARGGSVTVVTPTNTTSGPAAPDPPPIGRWDGSRASVVNAVRTTHLRGDVAPSKSAVRSAPDATRLAISWRRLPRSKHAGATTAMVNYYRALFRETPRRAEARIRPVQAPTLVIWGEHDRFLGAELAEPGHADVPRLDRVVRLHEASQWVQHDQPDRVAELLVEFFGRTSTHPHPAN
jgi:hypothetical protein